MKKPIRSSNLMLRFYVSDGWTKEELEECTIHRALIKGSVSIKHPEDKDPYFTIDDDSHWNYEKLLSKCSKLHRAFDDYPHESDLEFMRKH